MHKIKKDNISLVFGFSVFTSKAAAMTPMNTRYPPKVLGSPGSPSKGALTRPPPRNLKNSDDRRD